MASTAFHPAPAAINTSQTGSLFGGNSVSMSNFGLKSPQQVASPMQRMTSNPEIASISQVPLSAAAKNAVKGGHSQSMVKVGSVIASARASQVSRNTPVRTFHKTGNSQTASKLEKRCMTPQSTGRPSKLGGELMTSPMASPEPSNNLIASPSAMRDRAATAKKPSNKTSSRVGERSRRFGQTSEVDLNDQSL